MYICNIHSGIYIYKVCGCALTSNTNNMYSDSRLFTD